MDESTPKRDNFHKMEFFRGDFHFPRFVDALASADWERWKGR